MARIVKPRAKIIPAGHEYFQVTLCIPFSWEDAVRKSGICGNRLVFICDEKHGLYYNEIAKRLFTTAKEMKLW